MDQQGGVKADSPPAAIYNQLDQVHLEGSPLQKEEDSSKVERRNLSLQGPTETLNDY